MCALLKRQGFNWIVYDNQNLFYGYDLEDASDHGYDYESDDLPAGCHFEDDGGGDKVVWLQLSLLLLLLRAMHHHIHAASHT